MSDRTPRYTLEGPCASWAFQGRDGRWYRVCVPCDTVIPPLGTLPAHLRCGYACQRDAEMSVRAHVRDMEANRHTYRAARARQDRIMAAAVAEDFEAFLKEILGVRYAHEIPDNRPRWDQLAIMADHVARVQRDAGT